MNTTVTDLGQLDLNKRYTYADYLTWKLDEYIELIRGRIFRMSPAPSRKHQEISINLSSLLWLAFQETNCKVFHAPFDVRLFPISDPGETHTVVQPDICVVCDPAKLDAKGCLGAPDLIVEIISRSTSKRDSQEKFALYEEAGVREYWIVIPEVDLVEVYQLQAGKYQIRESYGRGDHIPVGIMDGLALDTEKVFGA